MIEQKDKFNRTVPKSQFLDTIIDCITEKNNSPNKKIDTNNEEMNLTHLYGKAGNIIAQLDTSINRCKKFNQAKINRKYQIIIHDLQAENKRLSQKLKLQQDARSPTKKHISDILDKLVVYRDQNIRLKGQALQKDKRIHQLQNQLHNQTKALQKIQSQHPKAVIERLPAINSSHSIAEQIKNFLKDKQLVKKLTNKSASKLQKFLNQSKSKIWNWNVPILLEQLEKWSQGVSIEKADVDMWKIRSSIARKFSDYIDNSGNLTRPSRASSIYGSQLPTARQSKYVSARNLENFSYNGSKQKLNFSAI